MHSSLDSIRSDVLDLEIRDRILWITINRADVRNAINAKVHGSLARVFYAAEDCEDVDTIVFTGAGDAFCAGGDLDYLEAMTDDPAAFVASLDEGRKIINGFLELSKPIVGRIPGDAIGLGATLALMCDITVATQDARIADPHVRVGLVAGDGGAIIWPALVGLARAKEFLLTGALVSGARAAEMGLVNYAVADAAALDEKVAAILKDLKRGSSQAIRMTKRLLNAELKRVAAGLLDQSLAYENLSQISNDHQIRIRRMLEKK